VHISEKGGVKIDEIEVGGLVFDDRDLGIHVDIESARLPKGIDYTSGEPVRIDKFDINSAWFKVDDLRKLGGGGSSSGGSLVPLDLKFLDHLNGQVDAEIDVFTVQAGLQTIPLRLTIANGAFDYKVLESQLPSMLNWAVDFYVDVQRSVFEISLGVPIASPAFEAPIEPADLQQALPRQVPPPQVGPGGMARPVVAPPARPANMVKLSIFYNGYPVAASGPRAVSNVAVRNLRINLSLNGPTAIDFGWRGKIGLGSPGKPGVLGLTATGGTERGVELRLTQVNASIEKLRLGRLGETQVDVPSIQINADSGTWLQFDGFIPKMLSGTIESATAENITVAMPKKPQP
jgi:hypothetical protein